MSKYIDADRLKAEIEKHIKEVKDAVKRFTPNMGFFDAKLSGIYDILSIIDSLQQEQPEVFDTVAFQKGVQEGRRLEREDALTVADIEKLHTFLYAVKNGKHGAFTFTRLTDEQYEEVLRRFKKTKEQ